jgi:hypothetical protein
MAQPPASLALQGKLQGYVAEAAVPRFVNKNGQPVLGRRWNDDDKMVDTDEDSSYFVPGAESIPIGEK